MSKTLRKLRDVQEYQQAIRTHLAATNKMTNTMEVSLSLARSEAGIGEEAIVSEIIHSRKLIRKYLRILFKISCLTGIAVWFFLWGGLVSFTHADEIEGESPQKTVEPQSQPLEPNDLNDQSISGTGPVEALPESTKSSPEELEPSHLRSKPTPEIEIVEGVITGFDGSTLTVKTTTGEDMTLRVDSQNTLIVRQNGEAVNELNQLINQPVRIRYNRSENKEEVIRSIIIGSYR